MGKSKAKTKNNLHLKTDLREELDETLFEAIVMNFPDIIHSVDRHGRILAINKKATQLLGYDQDELVGESVFKLYTNEIMEDVKRGFEHLKKQGVIERVESKFKSKSGQTIDVEMRSFSLYDDQGEFVKTFTITRDIRELNQLKAQLIHQSKLAAIGELASGIMHDIRNPLSVIISYNEVLEESIPANDMAMIGTCQKSIAKAAEKILRLSEHLRSFSRFDNEAPESIDLNGLLGDCFLMLEKRIRESQAKITNLLQGQDIRLEGKPHQLEQVFINLIGNACDAIKDHHNKDIEIAAQKEHAELLITISDRGPGIKQEHQGHIFDAFFTTKPRGVGTGLGLSICASIVKDHGGSIDFSSEYGQGTTFFIRFPLQKKPTHLA